MAAEMFGLFGKLQPVDQLQSECLTWWQTQKAQSREELAAFLHRRSGVTEQPTLAELFKPRHPWPGFASLELLRHHDLRAAWRRAGKMAKRLAKTGGLRVHHRPASR